MNAIKVFARSIGAGVMAPSSATLKDCKPHKRQGRKVQDGVIAVAARPTGALIR